MKGVPVPMWSTASFLDLNWSEKFTSTVGYSILEMDNTDAQANSAFERGQYASVNLLWTPVDHVMTGAELLWGQRTDNDGAQGDDIRLQYTFKVDFSSGNLLD